MTEEQANQLQYIYDRTLNNGKQISTCMDLGTGTSFNVKAFDGYENFTANNFLINAATTVQQYGGANEWGDIHNGWGQVQLIKTYDATTGTLTAYIELQVRTMSSQNSNWHGSVNYATSPVQVYIIF